MPLNQQARSKLLLLLPPPLLRQQGQRLMIRALLQGSPAGQVCGRHMLQRFAASESATDASSSGGESSSITGLTVSSHMCIPQHMSE